jgi:uncharacterized protein YeaO (DUF488 family)
VAPSTALRKRYSHNADRFEEFGQRYETEPAQSERAQAVVHLRDLMTRQTLTLLMTTRQPEISEALVLAAFLRP